MKNILSAIFALLLVVPAVAVAHEEDVARRAEAKPAAAKPTKTDANITGHVVDKITGEHIPFAAVSIDGTSLGAVADESGHYMITDLPEGEHRLVARMPGYIDAAQTLKVEKGNTYVTHFALTPRVETADQVVVTANRYGTKKRQASSIVNVSSPKLFEQTLAVNPAGVLDFQPGARVEYSCGNCGVPQLRINGLSGQYSQVLLDSRPIFSSLGMVYGLEQLPSSMIERVEVIRGGGSALFGSNAIAGTVNIITKEPSRSMFQLNNLTGLVGGRALDVNTSLNGSLVSNDGRTGAYLFSMIRDRAPYDRNDDGFSELPELKSQTIGLRGFQKVGKRSKLTAEYHYIHEFRRGGDLFDKPAHEANIAEQLNHNIQGGSLGYDYVSKNGNNAVNIFFAGQHIDRDSYFGTHQNPDAYGSTQDITLNAGAQWIHRFAKLGFMPATFTAGVDYNYNNLADKMLGYNRELKQITNLVGVYAQNEWSNDKLSLLLGLRLDKHSMIQAPILSPRVSVRYAPTEHITLRAGYARGYRAPQTYDEDLHVGAVGGEVSLISVSPDLRPEYSNTVNASFDYWKQFGNWQINLLAEGFFTDLRDVFALEERGHDEQGNLLLERVNAAGAMVAGVNLEARIAYLEKFNVQLGYTWQQSRYHEPFRWSDDVEPQRKMFRTPDSYGYVTIDYKPVPPLTLTLSGTYTGRMLLQHFAGAIPSDTEVMSPHFVDLSPRVAYDFRVSKSAKMQVSLAVKNVLDQFQNDLDVGVNKDSKYIYGPAMPRSFFIGLKFYI